MNFDNIEMSYKIATDRHSDQIYKFTFWMKGKKQETKITHTESVRWFRDPKGREDEAKQYLLEQLIKAAKYTFYDIKNWCWKTNRNMLDLKYNKPSITAMYKRCKKINEKMTRLNEGKSVHNYTFVGTISKFGCVGYEEIADDDWEELKAQSFRIYRLKPTTETYNLEDRLLRIVRDRYPDFYQIKQPLYRIFSDEEYYQNYIAYFFPDGQWGMENCEDKRIVRLQKMGAKIFKLDRFKFHFASFVRSRPLDDGTWDVEVKLHRVMRDRYGVKPNSLD